MRRHETIRAAFWACAPRGASCLAALMCKSIRKGFQGGPMAAGALQSTVTLKVFGDESADETRSRVFAVAGVIGSEAEWQLAMRDWLRRTRGMSFHANECE